MISSKGNSMLQVERNGSSVGKNRAGQTKALESELATLYEEYYVRIARYIFIRIGDRTEAQDLAGEVFLRALRSLGSYRGRSEGMKAWLFRIAHNIVVDHLRKMSKRKAKSLDGMEIPDSVTVEEVAERNSQIEILSHALERLTPAQREVIALRFFGGLSSAEVGKILGKSSGAVREMQRGALVTLRKLMGGSIKPESVP